MDNNTVYRRLDNTLIYPTLDILPKLSRQGCTVADIGTHAHECRVTCLLCQIVLSKYCITV